MNQYSIDELIDSVRALSAEIGGSFDYSISAVPDRGEFISFSDIDMEALNNLYADECPLTGCHWDYVVIENIKNSRPEKILDELHKGTEYVYSSQGLLELCESNDYEFLTDGTFYTGDK